MVAYLNGGALTETDRICQVRMLSTFLGVHLDQLQLIPHSVDQVVEAERSAFSVSQTPVIKSIYQLQVHLATDDHSVRLPG